MEQPQQPNHKRLVTRLVLVVIGMFVFAVGVMPPMYDVICDITGLNGKTANEAADGANLAVNEQRSLTIQFLANTDPAMPWSFKPNTFSMKVHPGEIYKVDFHVRNPTARQIVGQAIPSVSPGQATPYFKKTECFCFRNQVLAGGEEMDMPLIFYVDPKIPENVRTITLSYQLYDITEKQESTDLASYSPSSR